MAKHRLTFIVVPHGAGGSKSVAVSATVVKLLAGVATVIVASLLAALVTVLSHGVSATRNRQLEHENQVLARELERLGGRVDDLSDTLAMISRKDQEIRLVAGLTPLDPDVRRAGIGGPAGPWPEREELLTQGGTNGRRAFGVHASLDALIRRANLLATSFKQASDSLQSQVQRLAAMPSIMPTTGFLSSKFSSIRYHPILHENRPHEGVDITAPYGTEVVAPAAGRVVRVGWENGYGLEISIDHGYGIETRYAHLSRTGVTVGQTIKRGDRLGWVGSTGLSIGPHLHYEVLVNGRPTDPLKYVMPNAIAD
jgi:murein DD-endopeptidase MepM/ murein hydrolase activator NlpD